MFKSPRSQGGVKPPHSKVPSAQRPLAGCHGMAGMVKLGVSGSRLGLILLRECERRKLR